MNHLYLTIATLIVQSKLQQITIWSEICCKAPKKFSLVQVSVASDKIIFHYNVSTYLLEFESKPLQHFFCEES